MDYCSSCRRHLNGALVCPGCGAYAPDIAPVVTTGRMFPAPAAPAPPASARTSRTSAAVSWGPSAPAPWHGGGPHPTTDEAAFAADMGDASRNEPSRSEPSGSEPSGNETSQGEPADDFLDVAPAPPGRAARRRQRARWKKNQRRAVVATAVALVGGGLTLSAMDRQSGDRAQAATAPETAGGDTGTGTDTGMGSAEEPSAPYTRPDSGVSSPTSSAPDRPSRQRAEDLPRSTPSNLRPDEAAAPRATAESTPPERRASRTPDDPTSGPANAAPPQASTPTSTPSDDTGSATPEPTSPAPATPSPADPSNPSDPSDPSDPSQLCLLVICLG